MSHEGSAHGSSRDLIDREAVAALADTPLDWRYKGLPSTADGLRLGDLGGLGWNAFAGDVLLPTMLLRRSAVAHNVESMRSYCRANGVSLAPHAKTHMSPQLLQLQADAGAWGFTVATTSQARVLRAFGVTRILIAGQVVEPAAVAWIVQELVDDQDLDVICLVDDASAASWLSAEFARHRPPRPLRVLVEVGYPGGRTGTRDVQGALDLAALVAESSSLELAGLSGYEGLLAHVGSMTEVDAYLASMRHLLELTVSRGLYAGLEVIVSAGGSAAFDRVVANLTQWDLGTQVRTVLRSGCYLTHDSGMYDAVSPFGSTRGTVGQRLVPALQLLAAVWSRPEPSLVLGNAGKRDTSYDVGLPVVEHVLRGGERRRVRDLFSVEGLNDQHVFVRVPEEDAVRAGDILSLGISHPCTAFERWPLLLSVDDEGNVLDGILTFF